MPGQIRYLQVSSIPNLASNNILLYRRITL
jgi:hypothetical protein